MFIKFDAYKFCSPSGACVLKTKMTPTHIPLPHISVIFNQTYCCHFLCNINNYQWASITYEWNTYLNYSETWVNSFLSMCELYSIYPRQKPFPYRPFQNVRTRKLYIQAFHCSLRGEGEIGCTIYSFIYLSVYWSCRMAGLMLC